MHVNVDHHKHCDLLTREATDARVKHEYQGTECGRLYKELSES